jgi:hypothetical protein
LFYVAAERVLLFYLMLSRERHLKFMAGLETEVTQKMQQLQLLTAENEMLRLRAAVLEAAVAGRDEVVRCACSLGTSVNRGLLACCSRKERVAEVYPASCLIVANLSFALCFKQRYLSSVGPAA